MKKWIIYAITALVLVAVGIAIGISFQTENKLIVEKAIAKKQMWTCSMHPSIMLPSSGKCPICHMALIKADQLKDVSTPNTVKLPDSAVKMLQVQTSPVKRREVNFSLPLVGNIEYDETKTAMISAHFNGRVKKLYLNYVGAPVKKGQTIALFFSPDLLLLKRELQMLISDYQKATSGGSKREIESAEQSILSIKAKIESWKLDPKQILKQINLEGITPTLSFPAPISGVVTGKNIVEGQYFKRGDKLMSIADTSVMWAVMDAYETDLPWLRYGQQVQITAEAIPGQVFKGMIAYIAPEVNKKTRTVGIRANVLNLGGQLRSGMFIKAKIKVEIGSGGRPVLASLAGKWISPMHPEIIKDKPGKCDVCGMQLVPVSSLMPAINTKGDKLPLVIPASSILFTGKRSLVYLEIAKGSYTPRRITLGARVGNYYIVKSGLQIGDKVVTNGNFQIDSTAQINRTESMMNPPPEKQSKNGKHYAINSQVMKYYFQIWRGLAADNLADAKNAAKKLAVETKNDPILKVICNRIKSTGEISIARADFRILSAKILKRLKHSGGIDQTVYQVKCPMAFNNQGAFWLQDNKDTLNPYFGKAMLHCGGVINTIAPKQKAKKKHEK
jgi:membrane fusion protein, copper/silver efflux system